MHHWHVGEAILPLSLVLYASVPVWMLVRGWPIRAGLFMGFTAVLPWCVWLAMIPGKLGPGAGIAMMLTAVMLLLALLPLSVGVVLGLIRFVGKRRGRAG